MTPELQSAAERYRANCYCLDNAVAVSPDELRDTYRLIQDWLALHDATPIDEAWLDKVGIRLWAGAWKLTDALFVYQNTSGYWLEGTRLVTTRGELRMQCRLLGVELKEPTT